MRRATDPWAWTAGNAAISIHALLAESDFAVLFYVITHGAFLSTLSLRRATVELVIRGDNRNISIHALLAESDRLDQFAVRRGAGGISIHALLAESDHRPI